MRRCQRIRLQCDLRGVFACGTSHMHYMLHHHISSQEPKPVLLANLNSAAQRIVDLPCSSTAANDASSRFEACDRDHHHISDTPYPKHNIKPVSSGVG